MDTYYTWEIPDGIRDTDLVARRKREEDPK